jgi:ABC-type Fe3+ transport system permease subunit
VLVALLGAADVGTILLLHPPGRPNLSLAIFTIMGNAPESLVAALCLLYMTTAGAVLWLLAWRGGSRA